MVRPKGTKNSADAKKTGPKNGSGRTPTEVQSHRARIQELDLQGYAQSQIAKAVGLSQPMVCLELKAIRQAYHDAYVDDRKAMVMKETSVLLDVRRRAYEAIDKIDRRGKRKRVDESGENQFGGFSKAVKTKEDGSIAEYLHIISDTEAKIARLWGLEELPKTVFNVQVNNNTSNIFDRLLAAMLGGNGQAPQAEMPAIVLGGSADGEVRNQEHDPAEAR